MNKVRRDISSFNKKKYDEESRTGKDKQNVTIRNIRMYSPYIFNDKDSNIPANDIHEMRKHLVTENH